MPKVAFREADVARLVKGAIKGGMPADRICVRLIHGEPAVVQIDPERVPAEVQPRDDGAAELDDVFERLKNDIG